MQIENPCPVCQSETVPIGTLKGKLDGRDFFFRNCPSCQFSYVQNYRTDFSNIYNDAYYRGNGADPMVDYVYELQNMHKTVRNYEWQGVIRVFNRLRPTGGKWLDYGCGAGGLVKAALARGIDAIGFEEGWAASAGRAAGASILTEEELAGYEGSFDFVSAIEVLEHIPDPIAALKNIRRLLKPGGIVFITTGNAEPWRGRILQWPYAGLPDVHVSFYEPRTLAICLEKTGFKPENHESMVGFTDIIKFKVLKNLGRVNKAPLLDMLPWSALSRIVDAKHRVSKQPYGIAT
jgi:SAM-dependent methyltransferase